MSYLSLTQNLQKEGWNELSIFNTKPTTGRLQ